MEEYEDVGDEQVITNEDHQEPEVVEPVVEEVAEPSADTDFYQEDPSDAIQEVYEKPPKKNIRQHIAEIQRIKYQALKENELLRAENERLSMLSNATAQTALQHYEEAAHQRLQAAKELKQRAYESGDTNEQINADVALSMAISEIQTLNQKKAEQAALTQQHYQQQYQPQPNLEFEATQWVERNPWFNPSSDQYDDWMAKEMHNYCNALDNNLYRAGLANKIMTDEYFEAVDDHANKLMQYKEQASRGLNMRASPNTVAPVRSYGNSRQPARQRVTLSAEERELAASLGVSDKNFLRNKLMDIQKQRR